MAPTDQEAQEADLVQTWRRLLAQYSAVAWALDRALQERHGIGISEFEALEHMAEADKDMFRAQELTDAVHLSQSAGSRLITRLERQGLVTRSACPLDRRGVLVRLTDAGRELYRAARPTHRAVLAATLSAPSSRSS